MPYPVNGGLPKKIENTRLVFLNQEKLLGVVDAVQHAAPFINSEPFLLLMPDNVYFGGAPISVQLVKCFKEYRKNVLGLIEITKDEVKLYGNSGKVEYHLLKDNICVLTKLRDKTAGSFQMEASNKVIRSCGRSIVGSEFFAEAAQLQNELLSEKDVVPVFQKMIANETMLGVVLDGKLFDCGHWQGYWAANQYWMQKSQKCN